MAGKRKRESTGSNKSKGSGNRKEVHGSKVHPFENRWADIPDAIVVEILIRLPIKPVSICKCVCKSWHSIISEPYFAKRYLQRAPPVTAVVRTNNARRVSRNLHLLNFDEFKSNEAQNLPSGNSFGHLCSCKDSPKSNCHSHMKPEVKFKLPLRDSKMVIDTRMGKKRTIIGCKPKDDRFDVVHSCNGLLFLCSPVKRKPLIISNPMTLVVCNPVTGEFIRLPQSENDKPMRYRGIYSGLGYLKKTNEYKVIRIYAHVAPDNGVIEIHTLGTRLWRNIKYHGPHWRVCRFPTSLDGSLHWFVFNWTEASILSFDLESETSSLVPCPSALSSITIDDRSCIGFGELKGSLCICYPHAYEKCLKFWFMKKYGDGQSWTEVLSFNMEGFNYWTSSYQLIFVGQGILIYDPSGFFIYCDPQKHLLRYLEVRGTSFRLEPVYHIPSLIRLKDLLKGDTTEVINFHSRCATLKLREDEEVLYLAKYKSDVEASILAHLCP